jgi:hypothetical protein
MYKFQRVEMESGLSRTVPVIKPSYFVNNMSNFLNAAENELDNFTFWFSYPQSCGMVLFQIPIHGAYFEVQSNPTSVCKKGGQRKSFGNT